MIDGKEIEQAEHSISLIKTISAIFDAFNKALIKNNIPTETIKAIKTDTAIFIEQEKERITKIIPKKTNGQS